VDLTKIDITTKPVPKDNSNSTSNTGGAGDLLSVLKEAMV
jgi:hypothetical protein